MVSDVLEAAGFIALGAAGFTVNVTAGLMSAGVAAITYAFIGGSTAASDKSEGDS